ncbi:UDP-N-acetylglucosamine--undecaprenyl-phosphate N-acetylglucosaminephosphotransferase [Pseudidiomarina salinarum]|uniref:UDP-N-acetylglucosamine--undecaprenyl-phosphate N-acetylglucosaminephosphotransferase n=1 Tax=Pseudidiomarina salinarum TaxID=435908 RepID=UPI00068D4569|nr:UDP-N-acetylglucosamine--undecaprenyl-phosphate N-acetylglucosaminephosphotransferase [Pseudidiomarina salinarum]RUO70901.1 undecaprenyl-phosphate alpha-N-acetylglucosaminyl 1-phosphate transferase [Pseudidiomarina salinarum]
MSMIPLFIALGATALMLRLMHPVAELVDLLDKPCNRKRHQGAVPLIGGIAVFSGVAISMVFSAELQLQARLFLVSSAMMVFIGMLDDKFDLSVRLRLLGQFLAASVIIFGGHLYISNLGNLFGFGIVDLGVWGIPFTYLAILAAMNAYNMIDGIDGLLGAMGLIAFTGIASVAALNNQAQVYQYALMAAFALIPFIICNMTITSRYRKVFMGDAGSMFVGLTVVWLLSQSTQPQHADGASIMAVTSLWLVALPIMDMVSVMIRRAISGRNPTSPDRDHIHHLYLRAGFSPRRTLAILVGIAMILAAIGILLEWADAPAVISLALFLAAYTLYFQQFRILKTHFKTER